MQETLLVIAEVNVGEVPDTGKCKPGDALQWVPADWELRHVLNALKQRRQWEIVCIIYIIDG